MNGGVTSTFDSVAGNLRLADGSSWDIVAGNEKASEIIACLVTTMQLSPVGESLSRLTPGGADSSLHHAARQIRVLVNSERVVRSIPLCADSDTVTCVLEYGNEGNMLAANLIQVSLAIIMCAEARGAVLVHGALVEKDCHGAILAGPGGRGKTTASQRLVLPWRSMSDDASLVIRKNDGTYWVHPWPTWSSFMFGGTGGSWDVQSALPLRGVFFLEQAKKEHCERIGTAQAVCLLAEVAEQVSSLVALSKDKKKTRLRRLQRFDNICSMARVVPSYVLSFGREGNFWEQIERVLDG